MDNKRVVCVRGDGGPGSGYVVGPRLVVTSAHVVGAVGSATRLFKPGERPVYQGTVVWRGSPRGRDDAALVAIGDPAWVAPGGRPVRWGRTVTDRPGLACQAVGLPDVVQGGGAAEVEQVAGRLNPVGGLVADRYVVSVEGPAPRDGGDGTSPWAGLSGAGLFCGDVVCGVVASDPQGWGHGRLHAVPAYVLHHDPGFRAVLAEHGGEPGLEPAEWQHLAEAPLPLAAGGLLRSPAALLTARRAAVPFRGRTDVLRELHAWAALPGFGARLVHGPGGQGKTRLARQFAAESAGSGWAVLWLDQSAEAAAVTGLKDASAPLLVVLDYAESRTPQLAALVEAAGRHGGGPFKVLMLARTGGSWWDQARISTSLSEEMLDGTATVALSALEPDAAGRAEAYRDAAAALANALPQVRGLPALDWPSLARDLPADTIAGEGFGSALTLQMTALVALLDASDRTAGTRLAMSADQVEDRMLGHERRYWQSTAAAAGLYPRLSMDDLAETMALAAGFGAVPVPLADGLLAALPILSDQSAANRRAIRTWISSLYPSADLASAWSGLIPDRLAEPFLGRHLIAHPEGLGSVVPLADTARAEHLLTVCARAAAHPVLTAHLDDVVAELCVRHADVLAEPAIEVATRAERPAPLLAALIRIVDDPGTQHADLERLVSHLPKSSRLLAPWAVTLSARLVGEHRTTAGDLNGQITLAVSLHNWSFWLGQLGRREEGMAMIEEAIDIYRRLAEQHPDTVQPRLATSLNAWSTDLGAVGRPEEGLAAIQEAVGIYRRLAEQDPDTHLSDVAMSLNTLSVQLSALRRREDALAAGEESVTIRRRLADQDPDTYLSGLANSLNNWSLRWGEAGRPEEGLAAAEESVGIYRRLAEQRPDAFLPSLAYSLNNWALRLGDVGLPEQSLAASEESTEVFRRLDEQYPDTFVPDLAKSLNNQSARLEKLGRLEEAAGAIEEAVDRYRQLSERHPEQFLADLAGSLINQSAILRLPAPERALASIEEAVDIHRHLAEQYPAAFLPDLAAGLNQYSLRLAELGRREQGLAAIEEAVRLRRQLAEQQPDEFLPDLASSLNNWSVDLGGLGRWDDGLAVVEVAIDIYRRFAGQRPDLYLPELAMCLTNKSTNLARLGRPDQCQAAMEEAVAIRRRLAEQRPATFLPDLAMSLNNQAVWLGQAGQREDGLAAIEEAIALLGDMVQAQPGVFEPTVEHFQRVRSWLEGQPGNR